MTDAKKEILDTRECNAKFSSLKKIYISHLTIAENNHGHDAHVSYHKQYALKTYFLFLVGTTIYMRDLRVLFGLLVLQVKASQWRTRQMIYESTIYFIYLHVSDLFYILKTWYPVLRPTNTSGPSHHPLLEAILNSKKSYVWTAQHKDC